MKKIIAIIALFVVQKAFAQVNYDTTWVEYSNSVFGISIRKPMEWTVEESSSPIASITFCSLNEQHADCMITYQDISSWNMDFERYFTESMDNFKKCFSPCKVESIKDTIIDNCIAKEFSYTYTFKSFNRKGAQCFVMRENKVFTINFTSRADDSLANNRYYSSFINSFRVTHDTLLTIHDKRNGILIRYPFPWTVEVNEKQNLLEITAPFNRDSDKIKETIFLTTQEYEDPKLTLKEYCMKNIRGLRKQFKTLKLISGIDTIIDGYPANIIVFRDTFRGCKLKNMQVCIAGKNNIIVLGYVAEEKDYESYITSVKEMIDSIRLEK
jgi:hypothetical protein